MDKKIIVVIVIWAIALGITGTYIKDYGFSLTTPELTKKEKQNEISKSIHLNRLGSGTFIKSNKLK